MNAIFLISIAELLLIVILAFAIRNVNSSVNGLIQQLAESNKNASAMRIIVAKQTADVKKLADRVRELEEGAKHPDAPHKTYTEDFKMDCINYITSKSISCEAAAKELGVPARTLRSWVKTFVKDF